MKDKKITTIQLWKFLLVIGIIIGNVNNIVWKNSGQKLIFTGSFFISFFMFISGYYLVKHYKENKSKSNPSLNAWRYALSRFSYIYPALLGGTLFVFIIKNITLGTSIIDTGKYFMNSIWEFIGLGSLGLSLNLWNEPLWYLSALIIASLILYYILNKNEDLFVGILAPVIIILSIYLINIFGSSTFPFNLIRIISGLSMGMLLYYLTEYFQKKKYNETLTMIFSILHILLAMFLIYTAYKGIIWSEDTHALFIFIFCLILLVNKDYVGALYNDSKICELLGRLALYMFSCHLGFIYFLNWAFPKMDYSASIIFNILFTLCWAFIMLYFDDYVIKPIFKKKEFKKNIK